MLGIAVGITTVVALGVVTEGMRASAVGMLHTGGADFMVAQKGASDLSFSSVPEEEWRALRRRPDIARAVGTAIKVSKVGANPYFLTFGFAPEDIARDPLEVLAGRRVAARGEAMVGERAAADHGFRVGGRLVLEGTALRIVGVYRTGERFRDVGAAAALADVQELAATEGRVTAIFVTVARGADPAATAEAIERDHPNLVTIASAGEYSQVDQGIEVIDALNLAVSVLAVGIGAIGVMNTMIMSVFERTRELGILRALGWRGSRVLRLVIGESLLLCLGASVVGLVLGFAASRAVGEIPAVRSFLDPSYSLDVALRALAVGVVVSLLGALYPAYRAVRLSPMEALRYE
jgi:putative ABC transport system permease protein